MYRSKPIGVFDSGIGGLTVFRALREALPQEDFIYLGDMARLPYGNKSQETVESYALQIASHFRKVGIKLLIVACNTASAQALSVLKARYPDLPVLGVVQPGARAAVEASANGRIVVLATEGTVRSGAYQREILSLRPDAQVEAHACNLFVALAEEGWGDAPEALPIVRRYLAQIKLADYDTVVLGCTHFPLLVPALRQLLPSSVKLVDSAESMATVVKAYLAENELAAFSIRDSIPDSLRVENRQGHESFWVTDTPERFRLMATRFLNREVGDKVELIAL
ncbi:MAG: glutamate racemase [Proteobacteria bacterium]|jgi:glutamate racemase|nr:glutamate racemase [Alphaproteobacteria bacterium]NCC03775.1 glutamate racemase [Pseudomonadota bacterium]